MRPSPLLKRTMNLFLPVLVAVVSVLPTGIQIECRSWTPGFATKLTVTLVAADGSEITGTMIIARDANAGVVQDCFVSILEDVKWPFKTGPNDTIQVFAPKDQSIKSIKFDSTGWVPVYKRVLAPQQPKPKP